MSHFHGTPPSVGKKGKVRTLFPTRSFSDRREGKGGFFDPLLLLPDESLSGSISRAIVFSHASFGWGKRKKKKKGCPGWKKRNKKMFFNLRVCKYFLQKYHRSFPDNCLIVTIIIVFERIAAIQ